MALLVMLGFWLAAAAGTAVDPYDLYPWGARVKLHSNYAPEHPGYLTWMAARDPNADVIVVGSSTALLYTPDVIRATFPGSGDVWNLSYSGERPAARDSLLRLIATRAHSRRVIINLDYYYAADPALLNPNFPAFLYDSNPFNDLRIINARLPAVLFSTLRKGQPFATGKATEQRFETKFARQYAASRTPATRASWRAVIDRHRWEVDRPGSRRCSDFPAFEKQLIPAVRKMSERGIRVDILLPPYSPLMYYAFMDQARALPINGHSVLEDQLLLRRCAVTETANLPMVAVWAPDRDLSLITDIDNFRDPAHLAWDAKGQSTLKAVGDPKYRLTLDNVDDYVQRMRHTVVNFHIPDPQAQK
jgi:hypothetical protein